MLNITQEQLRRLLEEMSLGFVLIDREFRIVMVNHESARVDGREPAALIGQSFWQAWPRLADSEPGRLLRQTMEDRKSRTIEHYVAPQGRDEAWLDLRFHPFGQDVALFFRDITERHRAQAALRASQERFELVGRATNDVIWDWDIAANEIGWNDAAAAFFGDAAPLRTGIEQWETVIHPDDRQRVADSLAAALAGDEDTWSAHYRALKANGECADIYDRGSIIRDGSGAAVRAVGAMVDLTPVRKAEHKVRQLQSELIHVSRLSAMGTMASTLAHELKQPLTAVATYIGGCQGIVERGLTEPDKLRHGLEGAKAGALRAGEVIRRLKAMTERGIVYRGRVDLAAAIDEALALALIGNDHLPVEIEVAIPAGLAIEADSVQIQQVALNLVRNAIEAMGNSPRRCLRISARRRGGEVVIAFADTGRGLSAKTHDRLFEPFVSGGESGMGIGLSISRTIIEAHGGRIWAESNDADGATFLVALPASEAAQSARRQMARADR